MIIKSAEMPADQLGGVILNRRAQAVGLLVPGSQVSPSVRMAGQEYVYAISMRSALDLIKAAIMQATN
jgi:hypothetical protein